MTIVTLPDAYNRTMWFFSQVFGTLQRLHIQRLSGFAACSSSGNASVAAAAAAVDADIALSAVCAVETISSAVAASWDGAKRPDAVSQV